MSGSSLKCVGCLCAFVIVVINQFAFIIAGCVAAVGILISYGTGWMANNETLAEALAKLTGILKQHLGVEEFDPVEVIKSIGSVTGPIGVSLIVLGVVTAVLSCIGCWGACRKIRPCLIIYPVGVSIFFVAKLVILIIALVDINVFKQMAKEAMEQSITKYSGSSSINVDTLLVDIMHINLDCCGSNNGTDFFTLNGHWNRSCTLATDSGRRYTFNMTYPLSCCQFNKGDYSLKDKYCPYNNTASNYRKGCYDVLMENWNQTFGDGLSYALYGMLGILGFELLLIGGSIFLLLTHKPRQENAKKDIAPRKKDNVRNGRSNRVYPIR